MNSRSIFSNGGSYRESGKPYLLDWVMKRTITDKQVLLQFLSGASYNECAKQLYLDKATVENIVRKAAKEAPPCYEDDYLLALHACADASEFCRKTGLGSGYYRFLAIRYNYRATKKGQPSQARKQKSQQRLQSEQVIEHKKTESANDAREQLRKAERQRARQRAHSEWLGENDIHVYSAKKQRQTKSSKRSHAANKAKNNGQPKHQPKQTVTPPQPQKIAVQTPPRSEGPKYSFEAVVLGVCKGLASSAPVTVDAAFTKCQNVLKDPNYPQNLSEKLSHDSLCHVLKSSENILWLDDKTFWFYDRHTCKPEVLKSRIESYAIDGCEYSARYFYKANRAFMSSIHVWAPSELYVLLKATYAGSQDAPHFGSPLSIGFGTIDRTMQLKAFAEAHAKLSLDQLAVEYEKTYGFTVNVAKKWFEPYMRLREEEAEKLARKTEALKVAKHTGPTPLKSMRAPGVDLLADSLKGEYCDADLIEKRMDSEYPGSSVLMRNHAVLKVLGYYRSDNLFFRQGIEPEEYFRGLLDAHPSFRIGDPDFPAAVVENPTFKSVMRKRLKWHALLEYDDGCYLSFSRLHEVTGVTMEDINSYAEAVCECVAEDEPFTVTSLRAQNGFSHPLERLREEAQLPDWFFEQLIKADGRTKSCILAGYKVFVKTSSSTYSASQFMRWLVAKHEGEDRQYFIYILNSVYGIECPELSFYAAVQRANLYYDDIGDGYYTSMSVWRKRVKDELAH